MNLFLLFFLLNLLLIFYLYNARSGQNDSRLFWILIIAIYSIIFYQIHYYRFVHIQGIALLVQLIFLNLSLHSIYQIPFPFFYGTDAHYDVITFKNILFSGYVYDSSLSETYLWPCLALFGCGVHYLLGLSLQSVVVLTPFFIELTFPLQLYIYFKSLFGEGVSKERIIFISILFYISITNHIDFSSCFIRQTIALYFIPLISYFFYRSSNENTSFKILSILLILELGTAHHFTQFIFVMFCIIAFFYLNILKIYGIIDIRIILLSLLSMFSYWTYIAISPLMTAGRFILSIVNPVNPTFSELANMNPVNILTPRGYILFYGFFFFNTLFSIILLLKFRILKHMYYLVIFFLSIGFFGFLELYILPYVIFPDRLISFGWLFGVMPLLIAISSIRNSYIRRLLIFFIFLFNLYNIYSVPPVFYLNPNELLVQPQLEDYNTISRIPLISSDKILCYTNTKMAIIDTYNIKSDSLSNFYDLKKNPRYYDYIFLNKRLNIRNQYPLLLNLSCSSYYQKILDSNHASTFSSNYS